MICIVCRCDVADCIPKIGYGNMALLPESLSCVVLQCNQTVAWMYCDCAESGTPFPQQLALPRTPAEGMHALGGCLYLWETSLEAYIHISDPLN